MTQIEHRIEASAVVPDYSAIEFDEKQIAAGVHRQFVGGVWDTHGQHQFEFMKSVGLRPEHKLLDIGCGCFRAGRYFIDYLDPGNYFGIDANHSLLQTGYDIELSDAQRARLPISNLRANDRFAVDFGTQVDFALAQSVFTHVSLNHIRLCLYRASKVVKPGGSFYATFFERGPKTPVDQIIAADKPKPFYTEKNVFWYYRNDLSWAAKIGPWRVEYIGDWGHPVHQKMMRFVRLTDAEHAARRAPAKKAPARKPVAKKAAPAPTSVGQDLKSFVRRGRRWAARRLDPKR
jgi:SAM-dependent methyltransferase